MSDKNYHDKRFSGIMLMNYKNLIFFTLKKKTSLTNENEMGLQWCNQSPTNVIDMTEQVEKLPGQGDMTI